MLFPAGSAASESSASSTSNRWSDAGKRDGTPPHSNQATGAGHSAALPKKKRKERCKPSSQTLRGESRSSKLH